MELFNLAKIKIKNFFRFSWKKQGNLEVQQKQKQGNSTAVQQKGEYSKAHIGNTNITQQFVINNPVLINFNKQELSKIQEKNMTQLAERMQEIPQDEQTPIKPYQAYRALQGLQFVDEKVIAEMFIELLAKAGDKRYADKVHPGYAGIVEGLSPDGAQMLEKIYSYASKGKAEMLRFDPIPKEVLMELLHSDVEKIDMQISSLQSLGLIVVKSDFSIREEQGYYSDPSIGFRLRESVSQSTIDQEALYKVINSLIELNESKDRAISNAEDQVILTELGKQFLDVVFKSKNGRIGGG